MSEAADIAIYINQCQPFQAIKELISYMAISLVYDIKKMVDCLSQPLI